MCLMSWSFFCSWDNFSLSEEPSLRLIPPIPRFTECVCSPETPFSPDPSSGTSWRDSTRSVRFKARSSPPARSSRSIVLRYLTRTGTVNMYKEYRDVSLCGAVSQMYMEMSGRHSAAANSIQVIRTSVVATADVRRTQILQFTGQNIRFPKTNNIKRSPFKSVNATVRANRPTLYWVWCVLEPMLLGMNRSLWCSRTLPRWKPLSQRVQRFKDLSTYVQESC